jgi:ubiquinone biosynthesis protein
MMRAMVEVLRTVRNTERLAQIGFVLAKHGFGQILARIGLGGTVKADDGTTSKKTFAVRLREALQELGPTFVKLGQIVSSRPDVVPKDIVDELRKLQDDVPPMTSKEVDEILTEAYGATFEDVFVTFDREPLASASIGQVHAAVLRTPDGDKDVVVKLQRPSARATIERDVDLLYMLARLVERNIPEAKIYSPSGLVAEFDRAVSAELDFALEANNALTFTENFTGHDTVRFPHPYKEASAKRALVMERFRGKHLDDFVQGNASGKIIARHALHIVAKMAFEDGFFHADPHPGNIIMLGDPTAPVIGLIDLGLVGRLTSELRDKTIDLLVATVTRDPRGLADALLAMGRARGNVDIPAFRAEVETLSHKYLGKSLKDIQVSALIRDLVQGAIKYDIEMPVEITMAGKALMTIEGIGKQLDPDLDIFTELRPYIMRLVWRRYSPDRIGKDLLRGARELSTAATGLPSQLTDVLDAARSGKLTFQTRDEKTAAATDRLGRRLFTAIIAASLLGAGTTLLAVDTHGTLATVFLITAAALVFVHFLGDRRREHRK